VHEFDDSDPAPAETAGIGVFNAGARAIYIQPSAVGCEGSQPLVEMSRDGSYIPTVANPCNVNCQEAMETGWPVEGEGPPGLEGRPFDPCGGAPVLIEPGQTLFRAIAREVVPMRMPQMCAEGITTEAVNCHVLRHPAPGLFTLTVRGTLRLGCIDPELDCSCRPGTDGACTNPNAAFSAVDGVPLEFSLVDVTALEGQIVTIGVP
jgi:hypothetical protein